MMIRNRILRCRIGPRVEGSPARRPVRTTMPGRLVTLAPLDPRADGDALYEGIRGEAGDRLWQYLFDGPFADRAAFDIHLERIAASEDPLFFAILDSASGPAREARWDTPPTCESSRFIG